MLTKERRISKGLFAQILSQGRVFSGKNSSLRVLPIASSIESFGGPKESSIPSAFAFVVSVKTAKTAVERHFLKRRGRHVIKKNLDKIKEGYYCAFFFRSGISKLPFPAFETEIVNGLKQAGLIN